MKKRYLTILMMVMMACSFTACDKAATDDAKDDNTQAVSSEEDSKTEREEQPPMDENGDGESDISGQEEVADGPLLDITTHYYDVGEDVDYISGYYPTVKVIGDNYPELKTAIDRWSADYKSGYESQIQQYREDARQLAEDMEDYFYAYSFNNSVKTARLDNRITSLEITEYSYTGGAHGYDYLYGVTFDTQTGKEITFEDLGDIEDEVRTYIDEYIEQKRGEGYGFSFYEDAIEESLSSPIWYLDGLGLNVVFNAYVIGSYTEGRTVVNIPYAEMEHFNPDYKLESEAMFAELCLNDGLELDLDGDGTLDTVELSGEYDENEDLQLCLKVNDLSLDLDTCARLMYSYFVRTENGRSFVLVSYDAMSDDYATQLVEMTSGTPEKMDTVEGYLASMSNEVFTVNANVNALGTYSGKRTYTFSEGTLQPVEERYTFASLEENPKREGIVLKKALNVLIDENGTLKEKELPVGTTLYPIDSDAETVVGFELEDGTYGEITFERRDYTIYIDGISEYDIFENLPYAG